MYKGAARGHLPSLLRRSYTKMLVDMTRIEPSCLSAWEKRIGELPKDIGERYGTGFLTPRDWASHFKNVLHRTLMVRSITTEEACRCCGYARENLQHFPDCEKAGKIFDDLRKLMRHAVINDAQQRARFGLFAILPTGKTKLSWTNLHLLIWKYIVAQLVQIELEGAKYSETEIWRQAWQRFESKTLALSEVVAMERRRRESRGEEQKDLRARAKHIDPIATFTPEGVLVWNDELVTEIRNLAGLSKRKARSAPGEEQS